MSLFLKQRQRNTLSRYTQKTCFYIYKSWQCFEVKTSVFSLSLFLMAKCSTPPTAAAAQLHTLLHATLHLSLHPHIPSLVPVFYPLFYSVSQMRKHSHDDGLWTCPLSHKYVSPTLLVVWCSTFSLKKVPSAPLQFVFKYYWNLIPFIKNQQISVFAEFFHFC